MRLLWFVWHVSIFDTFVLEQWAFVLCVCVCFGAIDRCHQFFSLLPMIKRHSTVKWNRFRWIFSVSLFGFCLNTLRIIKQNKKKRWPGKYTLIIFLSMKLFLSVFFCSLSKRRWNFQWQNINERPAGAGHFLRFNNYDKLLVSLMSFICFFLS